MLLHRSNGKTVVLVERWRVHLFLHIGFFLLELALCDWFGKELLHFGMDLVLDQSELLLLDELHEGLDAFYVERYHEVIAEPSHFRLANL